jgi:hypothetical protein
MARTRKLAVETEDPEDENLEPEGATPITETPEPEPTATPIVNLDDEIARETAPVELQKNGVNFWFGHVGVVKFPDKTEYHVKSNRAFITDPTLIANLTEAAKNPASKIFPQ